MADAQRTVLRPLGDGYFIVDWGQSFGPGDPGLGDGSAVGFATADKNPASDTPGPATDLSSILARLAALERRQTGDRTDIDRLRRATKTVQLFEDSLQADQTLGAVDTWTALSGLSRSLNPPFKATAWVAVVLSLSCAELSTAADSRVVGRILVDGVEYARSTFASNDHDLRAAPFQPDSGTIALPIETTFFLSGRGHTVTVEASVQTGDQEWKALEATSTMVTLVVPADKPTKQLPTDFGNSWVRILDIAYDRTNDLVYALRIRGEYDSGTPAETLAPPRAFLEVVTYAYADLPLTKTIGGSVVYKRKLSDPANWQSYKSLFFGVRQNTTEMAFCWTNGQQGATSTSRNYFFAQVNSARAEVASEAWDGPDWLDDVNGYETDYGSVQWDATHLYAVLPTTDTAAKSTVKPFKSGWRLVKKNGATIGSTITAQNAGQTVSSIDLLPDTGNFYKVPVALVLNASVVNLFYFEKISAISSKIYQATAAAVLAGNSPAGKTERTFAGLTPAGGQAMHVWDEPVGGTWYLFAQQGYGMLITWLSSDPTNSPNWDDTNYNGDYDFSKIEIQSTPTNKALMFVRGAQGNALTEPWVVALAGNQGGHAGTQ